ncbi:MAG TPA: FUSC family protein [Xanthobacteraceae bacterium]|nr:FUSC family protein [Xanthobacteraceae bacterium]
MADMFVVEPVGMGAQRPPTRLWTALIRAASAAGPPLLFGVRLWASVCLALYVAYWLELDNAYWAGTSAALVCQPRLGASLRKGWFRMIGTLVGAVVIVVLTACFPQERFGFLFCLALWGGACALVATLLRNFAAYAAALAGYTAAIIASDQLGATGGLNGEVFTLAITRVSEIWIGIVCAGVVLAGTDFGGAPRRLAAQFADLSAQIASGFVATLTLAGVTSSDPQQPIRRELLRRAIALEPIIDESTGESSRLHYHSPVLRAAIDGLFAALAAWRSVSERLMRMPADAAQSDANVVLHGIPHELRIDAQRGNLTNWVANPSKMRGVCEAAVQALVAMPADTQSLRLLADHTANVLSGFAGLLNGLALLVADPARPRSRVRGGKLYVPDWLPGFVNAGRACVTIGAVEVFWIITQWPNGASAIVFAAVTVILLSPKADESYAYAMKFMIGVGIAAICAAIILFAGLPNVETFAGFSFVMGLFMVPAGALMAQSWNAATFGPMVGNFVPLLAPANHMSYSTVQFYNAALAIIVGCGVAALSFRLLPPLSPAFRAQRLLQLTLLDLRRLATQAVPQLRENWEGLIYSRLVALPDAAEPLQRAQLATALSVGIELIELRRIAPQLGFTFELDSALEPFARGDSTAAIAQFERLDQHLASVSESETQISADLRERGRILLVCDALVHHRAYFDAGVPR